MAEIQMKIMQQYISGKVKSSIHDNLVNNDHFVNKNSIYVHSNSKRQQPSSFQEQKLKKIHTKNYDYQPADYHRALEFKSSRSYQIKNYDQTYISLKLNQNTNRLKYFGLGIYFYIEFMRRISWLLLVFSLLDGFRIYLSYRGAGLSEYSQSFSTYLIKSTLGNYDQKVVTAYDSYIMALLPALLFFIFTIFLVCWKCHFINQIEQEQQNDNIIKPQKFALQIEMEESSLPSVTQAKLQKIFKNFGRVHQISLVKCYKNKLHFFETIEQLIEQIKQLQLELKLSGNKDEGIKQKIQQLMKSKQQIKKEMRQINIKPQIISAYVHFEYQKNKLDCLKYHNDHYLFDKCSHNCIRCFCSCCIDKSEKQYLINQKDHLYIKNSQVPEPQDINWEHFQLNACDKCCRISFGVLIILIFLIFSCITISLCTIYITIHSSNCDGVVIPQTVADSQISTDSKAKICFCNANLFASLSNSQIKTYCSSQLDSIYIQQGIQYAIIIISTVTNIIFGFVVDKVINCIRPLSESQGLKYKTLVFTLFIIFNTIFLPLILYSEIFGFKSSSYFSLVSLISSDLSNIFKISSLELYVDYSPIWYRNVSPIYTNFLILDTILVLVMFLFNNCQSSTDNLEEKSGEIIQKRMNRQIISYKFNIYKEHSAFLMVLTMIIFLSPGIPILLPIGFFNILSRYLSSRYLLQNKSSRIYGLGIKFNQIALNLLPILLILSCLNAGWMLTANNQIFVNAASLKIKIDLFSRVYIIDRELYLPFYIGIPLFILIENYILGFIIHCFSSLCSSCKQQKILRISSETKSFCQHKKKMNILCSYNIKQNDKMKNAVSRMEEYIKRN